MIDYQSYRIAIGLYAPRFKKTTKGAPQRKPSLYNTDEVKAGNVFSYFLYIYYVVFLYTFMSSILLSGECLSSQSFELDLKYIFSGSKQIFFKELIGKFFVIMIAYLLRKNLLNMKLRKRQIRKATFSPTQSSILFVRIFNGLFLWYLILNFLFLAIVNPSIVNPGPNRSLSIFYCNVQGLIPFGELSNDNPNLHHTKIHELNCHLYNKKPDIVIYNETWLKGSIHDNEVLPHNMYKVFRLDRSRFTHPPDPHNERKFRRNGGGVLIGIKHDIDIESKVIPVKCKAEILSVELTDKLGRKKIISTFYRVGTLGADNHENIKQHLNTIRRRRCVQELVLVGDLNLPSVDWDQGLSSDLTEQLFVDTFNDLSLQQLVREPTHLRGNVLDIILSDQPANISNIVVDSKHGLCGSDHYAISFNLASIAKKKKPVKRKIYNYKQANWESMKAHFSSVNWDEFLGNSAGVDDAWRKFKTAFFDVCNLNIPKITISNEFQPPWFDSEVYNLCRKKERLHKEWKETKNDLTYMKFSKARAEFSKLVDSKMDANFEDSYNRNLINKKFWSHVKAKSKSHRIPEVMSYNDRIRSDPQGQCELFNDFFAAQFSDCSRYDVDVDFSNDHMYEIEFQAELIASLLSNLNPNKAPGPDGIHGKILKMCSLSLSKPLSILFKMSYSSGHIPKEWKLANVVPVHKKGSKSEVSNYRPISLTCLIMKIYERVIRQELLIKCDGMIDPRQHGFMESKSCCTQLVSFCDSLAVSMNDNIITDIIYFDFQKAFDSVNHDKILHKLKYQYNIDGSLLRFFVNYLKERDQRVVIGNKMSSSCRVNSGVPQGSIVGPTLFILFLNDITEGLSPGTEITMYADDTKLWRKIYKKDDHWILQRDINHLLAWAINNKMVFHPSKSSVLSIRRGNSTNLQNNQFIYSMNDIAISYTPMEKDLGVHLNAKLDWTEHCNIVYSKANQRLGLLKRTCHFTKNLSKRRAFYLSQVRSHFEHCTIIWRPSSTTTVNKLESIQKRAIKWILNDYSSFSDNSTYYTACKKLNILPIRFRFDFKDMLFFHAIFYNLNDNINQFPQYLKRFTTSRLRNSHLDNLCMISDMHPNVPQNLTSTNPKTLGIGKSFFYRSYLYWNKLPYDLRAIESPTIFRKMLLAHLWDKIVDEIKNEISS